MLCSWCGFVRVRVHARLENVDCCVLVGCVIGIGSVSARDGGAVQVAMLRCLARARSMFFPGFALIEDHRRRAEDEP
jgi:hypothetical protein